MGFGCAFTVAPIDALEGTAEKATERIGRTGSATRRSKFAPRMPVGRGVDGDNRHGWAQNCPWTWGCHGTRRFSTTGQLDLTTDQPRYSQWSISPTDPADPVERDLSAMEVEQFVGRMTARDARWPGLDSDLMVRNITGSSTRSERTPGRRCGPVCSGARCGPGQAWFRSAVDGGLPVGSAGGQFGDAIPTGDEFWHVIVYPWSSRLAAKRMVNFGEMSFAGWPLEDLVHTLLEAQGVPEELILFELPEGTSLDDLKVPCARKWERRHAYPYDAGFIESFDELLASVGCRWRCTRTGEIAIFQPMPWNGIPDWVLDDADPSWVDLMEARRITTDALTMSNVVFHVGADPYGALLMGMVLDDASLQVTDHPMFVGEDRWSVSVDLGNEDPEAAALIDAARASVSGGSPGDWSAPSGSPGIGSSFRSTVGGSRGQ